MRLLDLLKPTPAIQALWHLTSPAEDKALRLAIQEHGGPLYPIVADEAGNIIDGHRTWRICKELGITKVWVETLKGLTDDEKRITALTLNCNRRHLTTPQRRTLIEAELRRRPSWSGRGLGKLLGVDNKTVEAVRANLVANGEIPRCPVEAADGRVFRKVQGVLAPLHMTARVHRDMAETEVLPGVVSTRQAKRVLYDERRRRMAEAGANLPPKQGDVTIHHCDFRQLLDLEPWIKKEARLIVTDPLYAEEHLGLWSDLGAFAKTILPPGGLLLAYSGVGFLDRVLTNLGRHLTFLWVRSCQFPHLGRLLQFGSLGIVNCWRPVLVYCNGPTPLIPRTVLVDSIRGKGKRKEHYEYEQPLGEIESLVQIFSRRGDLIVDPFGGSFTVAVACRKHGRRFVGCDIDEKCVYLGRQRVAQAG